MCTHIKQIEVIAKLPGYLFVLTCITDIHEKIFLYCSKEDFTFINSMLNQIGLQGHSLTKETTDEGKSLFMLHDLCELNTIILEENRHPYPIIYVDSRNFGNDSDEEVRYILLQHPNCIVVSNIEMTVSKKHFFIHINQNHRFYAKFQKHISRCVNTYGI